MHICMLAFIQLNLKLDEMRTSRFINPSDFKKKVLILLTLLFLTSYSIYAQGQLQLNERQLQLNEGQLQLNEGQLQLNEGQLQLNEGQLQLNEGQLQLNGGLGFFGFVGIAVYAGLDYGLHSDITVGWELSYIRLLLLDHIFGFEYNHSIIGISANGNYHFNTLLDIPSNWDLYAGLNLGFYIWNTGYYQGFSSLPLLPLYLFLSIFNPPESGYQGSSSSVLGLGAQIGWRYYFNDNWSIYLELEEDWGVSLEFGDRSKTSGGKIGVSYLF